MSDTLKKAIPDTVSLDLENAAMVIIDQTLLPNETVMLSLKTQDEIWEAIKSLRVRGAPAIGVAAAIGYYLAARELAHNIGSDILTDSSDYLIMLTRAKDYLASSRPTAVNLFWALDRMHAVTLSLIGSKISDTVDTLCREAIKIRDEDIASCRAMGEYGLSLINDGDTILTHCNAGQLATVRYGTALSPIHIGREKGMNFKVFCDETRPLLQGARLSAYELICDGVNTTVICDNMASQVMRNGWIDAIFVGADRIASNGDACNKIGTSALAILAAHYAVPFYVIAPLSTIDFNCASGKDVPIEQRNSGEITEMWYQKPMAPKGAKSYNPAFDYAENELITAIITDYGIARAPYNESLAALREKANSKKD